MNMTIVDRRMKVIWRIIDYELWKVNLIPGLMVILLTDEYVGHDSWLTWVISYWHDCGSGTILTHADAASIHMSMPGWISRTKLFYKVDRIVTLGSRYTYVNTSIWWWFNHPASRIEAISTQDVISHYL